MMPPLMTVGSKPPASSSVATSEVVVVLPCVPAMATHCFSRISSASISARRTTGRRRSRAAISSGIVAADRGGHHDAPRPRPGSRRRGRLNRDALVAQALDVGAVGRVRALHRVAEIVQHLGDARHADAADADEVDGAEFARQFHRGRLRVAGPARRASQDQVGQALGRIGDARRSWPLRPPGSSLSGSPRRARDFAGEPLRREVSLRDHGAPRRSSPRLAAFAAWSPSSECGRGTRIEGRPITASSATVDAPERAITRCAAAMRAGMSAKKGETSAAHAEPRIGSRDALQILPARLLHDRRAARGARAASRSMAGGTTSLITRAPWLPPKTTQAQHAIAPRAARTAVARASSTAGRTGLPVSAAWPAAAAETPFTAGNPVAMTLHARRQHAVGAAHYAVLLVHDGRNATQRRREHGRHGRDSRRSRPRRPASAGRSIGHEREQAVPERAQQRRRSLAAATGRWAWRTGSRCDRTRPETPRRSASRARRWRDDLVRHAPSASASASAGNRWPPVPPAASRIERPRLIGARPPARRLTTMRSKYSERGRRRVTASRKPMAERERDAATSRHRR